MISTFTKFKEGYHYNLNNKTGCHEWLKCVTTEGYGYIQYQYKQYKAHRLALILLGVNLKDFFVCHSCDNKRCVNPNHLFLGSHQDNMDDMRQKGRHRHGGNSLSLQDRREILDLINCKIYTQTQLADIYKVSQVTISNVKLGRTYQKV